MADRVLDALFRLSQWLVLPIVVLLFLQWPLREVFGAVSRQANDLGQILFAIYVAVALTAATRAGSHIAVDALARRYGAHTQRTLRRLCAALFLLPWAAYVAWTAAPMVLASTRQLETFPDTGNGGYFLVRGAVFVLAGLVLVAGFADIVRPNDAQEHT